MTNFKNLVSTFLFLMFCLLIYTLQQGAAAGPLLVAPNSLSHKIQNMYSQMTSHVQQSSEQFISLLNIKKKYNQLVQENQELRTTLQSYKEIEQENLRLKKILDFKETLPSFEFIVARVTAKDLFTDHYSLYIDRGTKDGIEKLAGVVTPDGIIGYIIDVRDDSARILLINDRLTGIDAAIENTRARGIISGYTNQDCQLKYIDRPDDFKVGDRVVTATDQHKFPPNFPIGSVESIKINPTGVGHLAIVKPFVDFKKLEEVIILKPKNHAH